MSYIGQNMHKMIQLMQEMATFHIFLATLYFFISGGQLCISTVPI